MSHDLAFDLDSLAVDVFSLADGGTVIESLTGADGPVGPGLYCSKCSYSCRAGDHPLPI